MYGKYLIFYDYHKNMVICAHAQTVDTRPLFQGGVWPGYEAKGSHAGTRRRDRDSKNTEEDGQG